MPLEEYTAQMVLPLLVEVQKGFRGCVEIDVLFVCLNLLERICRLRLYDT